MHYKIRDRFRILPKLFWGIVAGAFAIYSVLRDSVLKDLSPNESLAIVAGCVLAAAVAAIIISALLPTDREKEEGGLHHYAKSIEEFDAGNYAVALREASRVRIRPFNTEGEKFSPISIRNLCSCSVNCNEAGRDCMASLDVPGTRAIGKKCNCSELSLLYRFFQYQKFLSRNKLRGQYSA